MATSLCSCQSAFAGFPAPLEKLLPRRWGISYFNLNFTQSFAAAAVVGRSEAGVLQIVSSNRRRRTGGAYHTRSVIGLHFEGSHQLQQRCWHVFDLWSVRNGGC